MIRTNTLTDRLIDGNLTDAEAIELEAILTADPADQARYLAELIDASPELGLEFIQVYRGQHNGPFTPAAEEIDELRWVDREEIERRLAQDDPTLTHTFKTIWRTGKV